jgi:hypothetical protein
MKLECCGQIFEKYINFMKMLLVGVDLFYAENGRTYGQI